MRQIVEAAGATETMVLPRTAHTGATGAMGTNRETAVYDAEERRVDIDNLRICDTSMFPSVLVANPAPLITGLSLRTADRFLSGYEMARKRRYPRHLSAGISAAFPDAHG